MKRGVHTLITFAPPALSSMLIVWVSKRYPSGVVFTGMRSSLQRLGDFISTKEPLMFFQFTSVGLLRSEMPSRHHAC